VAVILIAVVPVVLDGVTGAQGITDVDWGPVLDRSALAGLMALLMAALAWAQRRAGK